MFLGFEVSGSVWRKCHIRSAPPLFDRRLTRRNHATPNWSSSEVEGFSHLIPLIRLKIPYTFYFHARYTAIFFTVFFLSRAKKAENSRCIKLFECCIKYAEVIKPRPLCSVFYWLTAKRGRIRLGRP